MSEIQYQHIEKYISNLSEKDFSPIYLIFGEEFFCQKALTILSEKLLMGENRDVGYELLEGDPANTVEAIDRVNTFSMLAEKKVVVLSNSRIFYEKNNSATLIENARQAVKDNDLKKGAKIFLDFLSINSIKFEDVAVSDPAKIINIPQEESDDGLWINQILDYCTQNSLTVASGKSSMDRMQSAIEKGFAEKNHLIITAEYVDKRRLLYKLIKEKGAIVDCSVPKGERKADKDAQNAILNQQLNKILAESGKTIDQDAFQALQELTGFDLRVFHGNVEKLIDFVGERKHISTEDIHTLLKRTKSDPIFEITNAVSDRNGEKALYYVHFLLSGGIHPLQILSAIINQVRKLMICRSFVEKLQLKGWHDKISYPEFNRLILPMVVDLDRIFLEEIMKWEDMLKPQKLEIDSKKKKKTASTVKPGTDLVIAKNPKNAYPIYQLMLKSALFSIPELTEAMTALYEADTRLKTTAQDSKLVLEKTIITICSKQDR